MSQRVLFLCTGNSARSVLAEATLRAWAGSQFEVFSAGSRPAGQIHPLAIQTLQADGISTAGLRSKSWDEFATDGGTPIDVVVTVCDSAAAEPCPVFFGDFVRTHWGLPDPAAATGTGEERATAFRDAHAVIKARLMAFLTLSPSTWSDRAELKTALDRIGFIESTDGTERPGA
ncbi:arsenate reductase ArsC [Xanthomonas sp. NCPPB 2632]|uniref:arsenate reductase ArsC n=1 Tax=Xanthomonas sp. NCPPB 2632 TaxID=3240912 RepID=UPI00351705A6